MEHHKTAGAAQSETFANHTVKIYLGIILTMTAMAIIIALLPS